MKKILLSAGLILGLCQAARAQAPQELFAKAGEAYAQGEYAAARDLYEQVLQQGLAGAELFYNLGNAYYRLGKLGKARLSYERASLLAPGDEDVRHNLALIRSQLEEAEPAGGFFEKNAGTLAWLLLGLNALFFAALAFSLFRETEWLWWARWTLGLLFAAALALHLIARSQTRRVPAVVLAARVEVRAAPSKDARVAFVAPEGQRVILFGEAGPWREVGVPEKSLKGWVPSEAVEAVDSGIRNGPA